MQKPFVMHDHEYWGKKVDVYFLIFVSVFEYGARMYVVLS